ncbi:hypothetical protein [Siphonobacter sp.]|uniref:hypothetical protein n=1 Tax=Siphonobacter sp. TaxID=1869184 RepID=UPI003B3A049D
MRQAPPLVKITRWDLGILFLFVSLSALLFKLTSDYTYPEAIRWILTRYAAVPAIHLLPLDLTEDRYNHFSLFFFGYGLVTLVAFLFCLKKLNFSFPSFIHTATTRFVSLRTVFLQHRLSALFLLGILALAIFRWIYYLTQYAPYIDELYSYYNCSKPGFLLTLVYYQKGNNHVFYNLINALLDTSLTNPLILIRGVSLIYFLLTLVLVYTYSLKKWGLLCSLFTTLTVLILPLSSQFAHHGRGYTLISLLALLSAFSVRAWLKSFQPFYLHLLILCTVLGAYTIPVYIYTFLGLLLFIAYTLLKNRQYQHFPAIIWTGLAIGLGIFFLYLPIFLFNGWDVLFQANSFFEKLSIFEIITNVYQKTFLRRWHGLLFWQQITFVLILFAVMIVGYRYRSQAFFRSLADNSWAILFLCGILGGMIVVALQGIIPGGRVWTYLGVWLSLALGNFLYQLLRANVPPKFLLIGMTIELLVLSIYSFRVYQDAISNLYFPGSGNLSRTTQQLARQFVRTSPKRIFVSEYHMLHMILLEKDVQSADSLLLDMNQPLPVRYDYLILSPDQTGPSYPNYHKVLALSHRGALVYKIYQPIP